MSTIVYQYGLLPPTENADRVREQMRLAGRYRNTLVEIARDERAALRALRGGDPAVIAARREVEVREEERLAASRAIKAARQGARKRAETAEMRARLTTAREAKKEAVRAFREALGWRACACPDCATVEEARYTPDYLLDELAIYDAHNARRRQARAESGLFWGTYLLIEDADRRARETPLWDGVEPRDPAFQHYDGQGAVAVQLQQRTQNGEEDEAKKKTRFAIRDLLEGRDSRVRLEPDPGYSTDFAAIRAARAARLAARSAWRKSREIACGEGREPPPRPGSPRRVSKTGRLLRLRVGSDGQAPIWASWPFIGHRPLPPDGVITWAKVILRRHGPREEWVVQLTIETNQRRAVPRDRRGAVAVDVGWRQCDDGSVRVAWWRGEDGAEGDYRLDARTMNGLRKADDLRAIRDRHLDAIKITLAAHLAQLDETAPEWLREATTHLAQWRSAARLAALERRWRAARFPGDAAAYADLSAWWKKDDHLWRYETGQRRSSLRARKDLYRCLAAGLASRYETLVIEGRDEKREQHKPMDLRPFVEFPTEDQPEESPNETARANRVKAAISELRGALVQAFLSRGGVIETIPAANTTRTCSTPGCSSVEVWDQAAEVSHRCAKCGTLWDQDENAAAILLARLRERPGAGPDSATARPEEKANDPAPVTGGRWARRKATKMRGAVTPRAAREAAGNDAE